jgi:NADPH:quinone reductase-like Zn-dependent oxidoreductase
MPELQRVQTLTRLAYSTSVHNKRYRKKENVSEHVVPSKMKAWCLSSFNGVENLTMEEISVPTIRTPKDVLIKVNAASLNPLDMMMSSGYGEQMLSKARALSNFCDNNDCFPLVLGRDFSGEVVDVGMNVTEFSSGDEVWGAVFPSSQGALAEYVSASEYSVS